MSKRDEEVDAMHLVAETMVPPYKEVVGWMHRLEAVANAVSDREAERRWADLIKATTESREAMDGLFRAAQLLRDSEVITGLEAAWVFGQLYEVHEWPFLDTLGLRARTALEAGFYEARGETQLATEFREQPEKCWADWEEGRFTLVQDMRGLDARLAAVPDPATVDALAAGINGCITPDGERTVDALIELADEIPHAQVTAAVQAAQQCRACGALTKQQASRFLIVLIAPVVFGMCQFDRQWRQLTDEMLRCVRELRSAQEGAATRRLWSSRRVQLEKYRARRESRLWAYCFRVFGEHEIADTMRSPAAERALAG